MKWDYAQHPDHRPNDIDMDWSQGAAFEDWALSISKVKMPRVPLSLNGPLVRLL
jgi:hypothetical protein